MVETTASADTRFHEHVECSCNDELDVKAVNADDAEFLIRTFCVIHGRMGHEVTVEPA